MRPSRSRILRGSLVAVAAVAASGPLAGAETAPQVHASAVKNLWATVNICDTKNHPDSIGIRGHAPGRQRAGNIWMRFFVEYQKAGKWLPVKNGGSTTWLKAGPARYPEWQEYGRTFKYNLNPGDTYLMRGRVQFQWRSHGEVFRREQAYTSGGHSAAERNDPNSDPNGYSSGTCVISRGIGAGRSLSRRRPQVTAAARSGADRPPSTRTAARPAPGPTGRGGATPTASAP